MLVKKQVKNVHKYLGTKSIKIGYFKLKRKIYQKIFSINPK